MAGKFTNLIYDQEAYDEELLRSTSPLMYKLDPNYSVNCNPCFAPYGSGHCVSPKELTLSPQWGHDNTDVIGQQVDIDSILKGISKINSKTNRNQIPEPINHYKTYVPEEECNALETQYTRYTHPAFDIKGLNVKDMRFSYPLHDPQCHIFENFEVNTRLQAKDEHRAIWQIPFNQRDLLPTERLGKIKNCTLSLDCSYAPYAP